MDEEELITAGLGTPSLEECGPSHLQPADCVVERIGRVAKYRWEHPRFGAGGDDDDDDDDDDDSGEEQTALEMDTEDEDGEDTSLESGQQGILVSDSLDEDFLAEVSSLGLFTLPLFLTIF
jgi:hypothetical protein